MPVRHAHKPAAGTLPAAARLAILWLALPAVLVGGCGRRAAPDRVPAATPAATPAGGTATGTAIPAGGCAVRVDVAAFTAYRDLAARLARGEQVPEAAYARVWALPPYAALMKAMGPRLINPRILTNVTRYVCGGPAAVDASRKAPPRGKSKAGAVPKREDLVKAMTWARDHGAELDSLAHTAATTPLACGVLPTVAGYLSPGLLPDTLRVSFLVAGPDQRWTGDRMLLDAGLAAAAGPARLPRLIAAQLYRALSPREGPEPTAARDGREALIATFAKLRREGVAAWLEDFPELEFNATHPLLGGPDKERREWHRLATRSLAALQEMLPSLLANPAYLAAKGTIADDLLRGNSSYRATGCAMAALIATRLGEPRLQAAARGAPADFLAAYQEAVAKGEGPALVERAWIAPGELADLPPFPEPIYRSLRTLLAPPADKAH
jgi:hypothetical protein